MSLISMSIVEFKALCIYLFIYLYMFVGIQHMFQFSYMLGTMLMLADIRMDRFR